MGKAEFVEISLACEVSRANAELHEVLAQGLADTRPASDEK